MNPFIVKEYIDYLNVYKNTLTKQQYDTIRGKLKQGDILAARKGLVTLLRRKDINVSLGR